MTYILTSGAILLAVTIVLGLIPLVRAAETAERMLAAQLLGTAGVGLLLLLAPIMELAALRDAAMVLALLAAVAVIALTRRERGRVHD